MVTRITAVTNCDDAVVFWCIDEEIADCWGFALERERKLPGGEVERKTLENRKGFEKDHPKQGESRPSSLWPLQRFWWADFSASSGDRVRYRVVPMIHRDGELTRLASAQSAWTPWLDLDGDAGDGISSYFNRGLVISQFMARYLEDLRVKEHLATMDATLASFKQSLDDHEEPIRKFLSGELRIEMLRLLREAKANKHHVYGALYELEDVELIDALKSLGKNAHLVLANGSITAKKGEGVVAARKRDENAAARKTLTTAGLEMHGRFISPGALGHNKFVVFANAQSKPYAAWTGSTNWTKTGLCTQINNGLLVKDAGFAQQYLAQWNRLRDAKSEFPKTLVDSNSQPKKVKIGKTSAELWFTRASNRVDLDAIDAVLNGAQEAVLFLMFQPGNAGALGTVKKLFDRPKKLYVKGVVSTLPPESAQDEDHVDVTTFGEGEKQRVGLDIVQPEGIRQPFANWAATVTRKEFLADIGYAIVHSKLIVVDPFTKPVVITGSHNFSTSASKQNDENFVILRDNTELAKDYAAHILSVYHHYSWMAYLNAKRSTAKKPSGYLHEDTSWQGWQLRGEPRKELDFWLRD